MQPDRRSAVIFPFARAALLGAGPKPARARSNAGRVANIAFLLIVLALAALWLIFPPPQLTTSAMRQASSAQNLLVGNAER